MGAPDWDSGSGQVVVRDVLERVVHVPELVEQVLQRAAEHRCGEEILAALLREGWTVIRDALDPTPQGPPDVAAHRSPKELRRWIFDLQALISFLVVRLAPNKVYEFVESERDALMLVCCHDLGTFRHLLSWASGQPSAAMIHRQLARSLRDSLLVDKGARSHVDWDSAPLLSAVGKMLLEVDLESLVTTAGAYRHVNLLMILETVSDIDMEVAVRLAGTVQMQMLDAFPDVSALLKGEAAPSGVFGLIPVDPGPGHLLNVGAAVGLALHANGLPRSAESVAELVGRVEQDVEDSPLCGMTLLWADLRQLAEYHAARDRSNRLRGVQARLTAHLDRWPHAWALCAQTLLERTDFFGVHAVDLLTLAASRHAAVNEALQSLASDSGQSAIRDQAQGILARISGTAPPSAELAHWLADLAARSFDGSPGFPEPLTPLTKTWLGSGQIEQTLARCLKRAAEHFASMARQQGASQEELVTGALLTELEVAFRDLEMRLHAGGRPDLAGTVSVARRPVAKEDEKQRGCDLALLLNADIANEMALRTATLVQIKKSNAFTDPPPATQAQQRWRIKVPQLLKLLERSQSAAYWLIASDGEVLCLPARFIQAVCAGRGALGQDSFTIGYSSVRHAAVPLDQFIAELLIGTWVGSGDEDTLRFARGEDTATVPRHIFTITVGQTDDRREPTS
ncbi:MAG: hypothetical protein AUG49_05050 [Catenulispora sp. 13_1_20CM_3_70_7]|nr:MAG: hypothetical protein AUG49_05050 [Catenulispora sp. 13_1_20CM_3_70_7]